MKCYNHHDRDAFGVCRVCGKGLCLECMSQDKEHGIYCKNDLQCKQKSELSDRTYVYNEKVMKQFKPFKFILFFFVIFLVVFFITLFMGPTSTPPLIP